MLVPGPLIRSSAGTRRTSKCLLEVVRPVPGAAGSRAAERLPMQHRTARVPQDWPPTNPPRSAAPCRGKDRRRRRRPTEISTPAPGAPCRAVPAFSPARDRAAGGRRHVPAAPKRESSPTVHACASAPLAGTRRSRSTCAHLSFNPARSVGLFGTSARAPPNIPPIDALRIGDARAPSSECNATRRCSPTRGTWKSTKIACDVETAVGHELSGRIMKAGPRLDLHPMDSVRVAED